MREVATNYKELVVWKKTRVLIREIYQATGTFPAEERYGLTLQIRRAAISISANIAEGFGRNSKGEFSQFSSIAYGSATELEALIITSVDLGFMEQELSDSLLERVDEVLRMLNGLRQSLRNKVAA